MTQSIYEVVPNIGYLLCCPITSETPDDLMGGRMVVTNRYDTFVTIVGFHKSVTFISNQYRDNIGKLINEVDEKMKEDGYTKVTTIPTEPKTYQVITREGERPDYDLLQVRFKKP